MRRVELAIIGGGSAGLAAAIAARRAGVEDLLIIERDAELGGILNQCVHAGFGLHTFGEELTGPEYAARYVREARALEIPALTDTMVLELRREEEGLLLIISGAETGLCELRARAVVLAMGCRERPRGALNLPGFRPAGIYSAGTAQRLVNREGFLPGREVVILGSGDIGLIMARRMTLEGAHVRAVAEVMPYSGGLARNIEQCLHDFNIPLLLSHTVVNIHGHERLTGVTLAEVDGARRPIPGTERYIPCDTLLLSVGLLPENELTAAAGAALDPVTGGPEVGEDLQTRLPGVFACGNVLHVHDLVDDVSAEAARAGESAARYLRERHDAGERITLRAASGVRYTVPQWIDRGAMPERVAVRFRVAKPLRDTAVLVYADGVPFARFPRRVVAPGLMEQVTLQRAQLPVAVSELRFELEERR